MKTDTQSKEAGERTHAEQNAAAWVESIVEMTTKLDNDETSEAAQQEISESPLSVEVRSGWHSPGCEEMEAEEFNILLSTGGPALRIIGDLDRCEPCNPRLQHQDWGTPWTDYNLSSEEEAAVLRFVSCFYFGE